MYSSRKTKTFRSLFSALPLEVQTQARIAFDLWQREPWHPSLHFKQVHPTRPVYSVRIGLKWRALAQQDAKGFLWFWIGSHAEYDRVVRNL
jgi:hypothetical protein